MKNLLYIGLALFFVTETQAQVSFLDKTSEAGIDHWYQNIQYMGGGCAWFDMNNDGYDDLWLTGGNNSDKLYINNQDGTFNDASSDYELEQVIPGSTIGVITGDLNNDGHREIILMTGKNQPNQLLLNVDGEKLENITLDSGIESDSVWTMSCSLADINLDGYLDIYFGNYMDMPGFLYDGNGNTVGFDHMCYDDELYLNNGDMTFTRLEEDVWPNQDGCVLASCFTDFDLDGDVDLMVANDFGEWVTPNRLFQNNYPEFSFTEVASDMNADAGIYGMGISVTDIELDGDLDYYITNLGRNVLLQQGDNGFDDITTSAGVENTQHQSLNTVGWGTVFEDINRDLYPDLFVSNGYIESLDFIETNPLNPNKLYLNNKDNTFEDISNDSGFSNAGRSRGLASSDFDNDGDADIVIVNVNGLELPGQEQSVVLYQNEFTTDGNWVKISLEGTVNNKDAYGSIVRCFVDDYTLVKEVSTSGTHASQNSSSQLFGLADYTMVDSISVTWPGGKVQKMYDVEVNQHLDIIEDESLYNSTENINNNQLTVFPNPLKDLLYIDSQNLVSYQLFDINGSFISQGKNSYIDVSSLNQGMYILSTTVNQKITFHKLIKE